MRRSVVTPSLLMCAVALSLAAPTGAAADTIPQATDAPRPLSPDESRKRFRLPEGLRVELVAAEPDVTEPTGLCFDARGRLLVCELHGYNLDGYYDIVELNKTGKLDTAVRRIPASKEAERCAAGETYGTVRLLETDRVGKVVRPTVFADRLPPCYGVAPARDGVIVLCAPDIIFLADRDGDGKAEVRETLFTGFGVGEIWTRISNPRWGPDNWIYAASGQGSGGTIRGPHLPHKVKLGSTCFRFKPDGSRLEPVSGGTSGFGLAPDDWGDRFLCTNQQHALYVAPLSHAALARNPYTPVVNISTYGHPARVFPASQPDPWRRKRGQQAEWVKFYGSAETDAGLFTSACAPTLYLADLLPAAYRGNHFSCEPTRNLIHRCLLEPKGAGFAARRADEGREFLTSTDQWFRPVNLAVGPEGALYILEMYREIIEDYSAIPRYLKQQYVERLHNGHDKGRIWRVVPDGPAPAAGAPLADEAADKLVGELASPNAWRRLTAQRLLVERQERKAVLALQKLARDGNTPRARLHALYALDGLDELKVEQVRRALADAHPGVRVNALRLAERWLSRGAGLLADVLKLAEDADAKVRLQLALTLGESPSPNVLPALARLLKSDGQDRWLQAAVLSAVPDRSARLARTLADSGGGAACRDFLPALAAVTGARRDDAEVTGLLEWLAGLQGDQAAVRQKALADPVTGDLTNLTRSPRSEERYPCWSPDGRRIAFISDRDGPPNLYVMDADGGNVRRPMKTKAVCYMPSWAGDRIVFGLHGDKPEMASIKPDGGDLRVLGEGHDPCLSPDGKRIATPATRPAALPSSSWTPTAATRNSSSRTPTRGGRCSPAGRLTASRSSTAARPATPWTGGRHLALGILAVQAGVVDQGDAVGQRLVMWMSGGPAKTVGPKSLRPAILPASISAFSRAKAGPPGMLRTGWHVPALISFAQATFISSRTSLV